MKRIKIIHLISLFVGIFYFSASAWAQCVCKNPTQDIVQNLFKYEEPVTELSCGASEASFKVPPEKWWHSPGGTVKAVCSSNNWVSADNHQCFLIYALTCEEMGIPYAK